MAIIDEFKELYKDLFEYSSDYLLLIELNGRIIEVNKFLLQNPDISASKILNTKIYEFTFQKEDIQEFDENKQFIWYKNSTEPLIIKLVKKNGTPLFIKVDKIPLKKNNQTIAFLGIGHDISKQIEMDNIIHEYSKHNNELKESEEIFRSIFKKSPYYLSVWRKVKVGFILFDYNNVAKKFSRFNLKELKGKSITEFPDKIVNRRIYIENVNRCFKEKSTFIEETELYIKALKEKRNFQVIYKYISPDLVLCHIEDFTRRVRTELKLKESEEKFRSLFKGTPHFTLAWKKENDDFILLDFNNNMEKITKGRISKRIGHTFSQIYLKEQKTSGLLDNLINCFEEKRNYSIETRMYLEFFKRERDFLITYSYIPPKYIVTHVEDITRRKREEQKLKESEEKYRTIIENAKEGYYEVDLKGNYTLVNNAYCKLFGYLREELIGKNYQNFTTKETINMTFKTFNKVYNTGIEQTSFEYVVINKNGNIKYGDTSIHLIHDLEGNKIGFRGFIKETTEKKLAEEKLKESEEKFRLISETSNDLIRIVNNEYRIEYINENTHLKLLGYSNEDLIGKHLIKILHPDELDQNLAFANKVREIGEAREELRSKHKDGHWIWFDVFAKEFFDKYGNSHGLIVSRDIRERKLAELKLKESEAKFRKLFKGTPNFTIAWQKEKDDFILIDYNDGAIEISNGGIRERVGQTASQMYIKELNRPDLVENLNVCFENKRNHTKEIRRYIDFLDTERDLRIKYTYIPPNLVLSQWEDITQRKKAEQQLKESEEKFRLITENSNDLIRIGNIDYKIEYLNENTHLKLLGYSKEDLIGKSLEKILHPDEEKKILNFAKRRLENGEAIEELRLRHKDRHWVWFDIFAKDFFDKYGNK
ncbi:MAG: PAS domain S-box protein, partial [Promethearchaeota archaeon]